MAVFRVERTQNYTVMSNYHLRDRRLSLKAKGLLSLMLSLPEDWDYTLSGLARISLEGKDAIRAAVANGDVYLVNTNAVSLPNLHVIDGMKQMAKMIYPDAYAGIEDPFAGEAAA